METPPLAGSGIVLELAGGAVSNAHPIAFIRQRKKTMKSRFKSVLAGVGAVAIASGMLLATDGVALAAQTPAYEPDNNATLGGIDFFNAAGVQITSGTLSSAPIAAYAVAQHAAATTTPKATLFGATPNSGKVLAVGTGFSNTFSSEQMSDSTAYPIAGPPADLAGLTNPIVTGAATDESVTAYSTDIPNTDTSTTDGFGNLYQLRIKESGATGYAAASIQVNTAAGTWTQVSGTFQLFADTSSTTLVPTPPSPAATGTVETLTATVADTTTPATPATGTVQFFDGATPIGGSVAVSGGTAHTTTTLATGSHTLSAVFTSSAPSVVAGSTSANVPYTVAALDVTSTTLSVNPLGAAAFAPEDLKATVSDTTTPATHPTGTVQFVDGTTNLGAPVAVNPTTGVAEIPSYTGFAQGTHSVTAVYSPAAGTLLAGSTGGPVGFTTSAPTCPQGEAANLCTDVQNVDAVIQAGTITITTPYNGVGTTGTLHLGNLSLNSSGTLFTASAPFGDGTATGGIFVTSTQQGDPNWTASVQAGTFTNTNGLGDTIDGQYAGLTNVTVVPIAGNALQPGTTPPAPGVYTTDNPAGTSAPAGGTNGIGGAKHAFANTVGGGDGSVGFTGTLTLNAPTSKTAGTYTGQVTFTVG